MLPCYSIVGFIALIISMTTWNESICNCSSYFPLCILPLSNVSMQLHQHQAQLPPPPRWENGTCHKIQKLPLIPKLAWHMLQSVSFHPMMSMWPMALYGISRFLNCHFRCLCGGEGQGERGERTSRSCATVARSSSTSICPFLSIRRESPLLRFRLLRGEREGAIFAERMSSGVCWEGVTQSRSPLPGLAAAAVRIAASRIGRDRHASCLSNLRLPIGWYPARLILEGGGRENQIGMDWAVFGGIYLFLLTTSSSTTARWKHQTGGKMPQMQDLYQLPDKHQAQRTLPLPP